MSEPAKNFNNKSNKEKIVAIATGGLCIALSFILSKFKIFEMPMGGSVTPASVLPLAVYGMAFGPVWGFLAAILFSLLQLIDGYLETPFQVILDYILGYTAMGIIGFAAVPAEVRKNITNPLNRFAKAGIFRAMVFTVIAYAVRCLCSVLSGVIFYAEYAPEGMSPWVYSITYNGSFLLADLAVLLVAMGALYGIIRGTCRK
ncbi:MAG TPA: energy-coupled thiamine transporter ThiT [Clostridiales bacterium]|nr:energy-coupled thiamine transporter ThiT [Clostridiales bacterium]